MKKKRGKMTAAEEMASFIATVVDESEEEMSYGEKLTMQAQFDELAE